MDLKFIIGHLSLENVLQLDATKSTSKIIEKRDFNATFSYLWSYRVVQLIKRLKIIDVDHPDQAATRQQVCLAAP